MSILKSKNLNYIYTIEYYNGIDFADVKSDSNTKKIAQVNKEILALNVPAFKGINSENYKGVKSFELKTSYPGMLAGVGSQHEIGTDGEFSLGFNLDYVTGTPYIPGSTVKGIIKSAFDKEELINFLLDNKTIDVVKLKKAIFEGITYNEEGKEVKTSSYERDIFFDSYPVSKNDNSCFDEDYITPHKEVYRNPTPITFLKIKPNVVFTFNFDLKDSFVDGVVVTAQQKLKLFENIIKIMGVGAKTNVGYGAMVDVNTPIIPAKSDYVEKSKTDYKRPTNNNHNNSNAQPGKCKNSWCNNITDFDEKNNRYQLYCRDCRKAYQRKKK